MVLRKVKGPVHVVHGDLDETSRVALRKMGCRFTSWPEVILKVFKVDVTEDTEALHPLSFCHRCWMVAIRGGGVCSFSRTRVPEWKPHSALCHLCYPRKTSFQRSGRKRRRAIHRAQSLAKRTRYRTLHIISYSFFLVLLCTSLGWSLGLVLHRHILLRNFLTGGTTVTALVKGEL